MNVIENSSSVEASSSSSVRSDTVQSTQLLDPIVGYVSRKQIQSTNKINGVHIENVLVGRSVINHDIQDLDVVSSTIDDENMPPASGLNGEQVSSLPFVMPHQMNGPNREKLLLQRVFNLIKADQEQNRMENGEESFMSMNTEVSDEMSDGDEKQYKCHKCNLQFARHSSLVWHLQSHVTSATQHVRGKKTDQIDMSPFLQSNRDGSPMEEAAGPFICDFCDKMFPSVKGMKVHIAHMHKFEAPVDPAPDDPEDELSVFACMICNREFQSLKALKVHVSHAHSTRVNTEIPNQNGMFACELCAKEFETPRARKVHVSHMHKSSFLHLNGSFPHLDGSIHDDSSSTVDDEHAPFTCTLCHKEFDSARARNIHVSHVHKSVSENEILLANDPNANEFGMFACDFCKKEFETMKAKKIHLAHKHKGEVLPSKSSVGSNSEISVPDTPNEQDVFSCEVCAKEFQSLKAKKVHKYHMHKSGVPNVIKPVMKPTMARETNSFVHKTSDDVFQCKSCEREFSSLIALRVHVTHMHTRVDSEPPNEKGTFTCDACGKDFVTTRARSIHNAHTHSAYKQHSSGTNEMDSIVAEEVVIFCCKLCDKEFQSSKALKIHKAHMHKEIVEKEEAASTHDNGPHSCDMCDKDFESLKAKRIHMTRAHSSGAENERTKSSIYRRYRSEVFTPNEAQVFPCLLCDRTFACKKGLSRHVGYHNVRQSKKDVDSTVDTNTNPIPPLVSANNHNVNLVPNSTGNAITLDNTAVETNDGSPLVNKLLRSLAEDVDKSKMEAKNQEEVLNCGYCKLVLCDQKALTLHHLRAHSVHHNEPIHGNKTQIDILECTFCHITFETVTSLHAHITSEHVSENLFTCIFCLKIFNSVDSFKTHIHGICGTAQNFDGVYLFSCNQCPKTFSHPKSLQQHWRCDHPDHDFQESETEGTDIQIDSTAQASGETKFQCTICLKSFTSIKAMAGHMSAHSYAPRTKNIEKQEEKQAAEQLYRCGSCPKSFSNLKSRAAHMKVHANRPLNTLPESVEAHLREEDSRGKIGITSGKLMPNAENTHYNLPNGVDGDGDSEMSTLKEYQCLQCPKTFNKSQALANHSRIHEFVCSVCPKVFTNIKALSAHSKIHRRTTGSVIMPSETSAQVASRPSSVNFAQVSSQSILEPSKVAGAPKFNVPDVTSQPNMNVNIMVNTGDKIVNKPDNYSSNRPHLKPVPLKEYVCLYCPRKFANLKGISTHSRVHGKGNGVSPAYRISYLNVNASQPKLDVAKSAPSKTVHAALKPNIGEVVRPVESFKCAYCPKSFSNAKAVAVHSRIHKEGGDPANSICDESKLVVEGTNSMAEFKCLTCNKVFDSARALSSHLKAHVQKGFSCPQCDKSYPSIKALAGHRKCHRNASLCTEPHIRPVVSNSQNHNVKVNDDSEGDKEFPCQFCGRIFPTHRGYARHVWTHTHGSSNAGEEGETSEELDADKPFACRICGIKFAAGRQLGGHMRYHSLAGHKIPNAIHVDTEDLDVELNEEDQFICDTCDEIFECREDLSEHVRNHADPLLLADSPLDDEEDATVPSVPTMSNSYLMCHICNRLFSGEKSLSTHMFKKHKKRKGVNGYSPLRMSLPLEDGPQTNGPIVARKRSAPPTDVIDLDDESMDDPIEMTVSPEKRICRSYQSVNAHRSLVPSAMGSRLAFGLRSNGEIYAQDQPNMAAQFCARFYECMYCERQFRDKSRWVQHVRVHPESAEYTNQELQDYLNLQTREQFIVQNRQGDEERFIFEQYSTTDGYRCSECDETFREKLQMLIHMSYHMDSKQRNGDNDSLLIKADSSLLAPFKCNFCGQRFINKKYRNLHLCKRHRSDILQCEICHKLFICKETLKQHQEQHFRPSHPTHNARYLCEYCGVGFRSKVILKRHKESECEVRDPTNTSEMDEGDCEIVENQPIKQEPMDEMSIEERDFEEDDSENPLCLSHVRSVYESFSIDQHTFIEDEKVKIEDATDIHSLICDCCNKRFVSESDMRTHEDQPQKILFCCGLCNLYFIDSKIAEVHTKMHIVEQENELDIAD